MPYTVTPVGVEPKNFLLRRGDVLRWIGISEKRFDEVAKEGHLPWKQIIPGGARFYLKSDVKSHFLKGYTVFEWLRELSDG